MSKRVLPLSFKSTSTHQANAEITILPLAMIQTDGIPP
jgi:hypothetical protein